MGVPENIFGGPQGQHYVHNNAKMLLAFHCIGICTEDTDATAATTTGTLGQSRGRGSHRTSSRETPHCCAPAMEQKGQFAYECPQLSSKKLEYY